MNAFSNDSSGEQQGAAKNTPAPHVDLNSLPYDDIADLLIGKYTHRQRSSLPPINVLRSLQNLTTSATSPRVLTFMWLYASYYLRNTSKEKGSFYNASRIFKDYWDKHGGTVRRYLESAPLEFLSENYKILTESMHHRNVIKQILLDHLDDIETTASPDNAVHLLKLYRGFRLMPPAHVVEQIKAAPIKTNTDLREYIALLHGVSRAGISALNLDLMEPIKSLEWRKIKSLDTNHQNSLLWSLSAQFAFASDAGSQFDTDLRRAFLKIHNHMSNLIQHDRPLRRTFNLASILLDRTQGHTNYDDYDHMSRSEYEFMHDFREHGLTKAERANLRREGIEKHVGHLGRELDGHYILNDTPIIIEYDGKSHFRESLDGNGDEPNGSTKLQTHILRRIFPDHVIIRLHSQLGNLFTSLPEDQKPDSFQKLRELILAQEPNAYYFDLHHGKLRVRSAQELQQSHDKRINIGESPKAI